MEFLSKGEKNYKKARNYLQQGRFKLASFHLKMAEKKHFDKEKILMLKGIIELYKMNIAKAFEIFQRVLTFSNRNPDVYYYIGKCFIYFGNDAEAFDHFIKAYNFSNNDLIKGKSILELQNIRDVNEKKFDEIESTKYGCLIHINREEDENLRSKAIIEMLKGNYLKATEIITSLVQKQPRNFEAFKELAFAFTKMSNYDFALKALKKARSICRKDKTIFVLLARVYFYKENYFEAKREMRKALKYYPPHYKNFYNMGNICSLVERPTEAVNYFKKCIEINNNFSGAYFNMATIYHSEGMLDEGEKYYKMANRNTENKPEIHYNLGLLHYFKHNYFESLSHLSLACKLNPAYENAAHNFRVIKNVKILAQDEDYKEALPFNTKVLITFIAILVFLVISYIVRLIG
jgi:tetratricopeptide (TPR) repeat protein